jgi:CubicO group peptidase (beta-lactamase class C family)
MFRLRRPLSRGVLPAVALVLCSLTALGEEDAKTRPASNSIPTGSAAAHAGKISDPADLESFFDGVLPVQMESDHIAGAVVAVVVGDKLIFAKGYGYADVARRKRVDPETTMFRVGSVSKLFTWTAVMQQIEEGKLDIDADVNGYLKDVQIPKTFEQPITLRHLLTHTPGFEDNVIGLLGHTAEEVGPLAAVLRAQMPARVRPPGVIASYSNYGATLAGYAVACQSGMPWEDDIEERILKPLDMRHTLVRQPAADKLPADLSKGYMWDNGHFAEQAFEYFTGPPAGCISMSAADAAKFMLAHLSDGQGGRGRILKAETARRMREPLFRHDPKTDAMCYGFMEEHQNGQRMVGHGGDTLWFHSLLQLIPELKIGLFVSYNTDTSAKARRRFQDAFLRRYFPEPDLPPVRSASGFRERAKRLAGEYVMTRYSQTSVTKLLLDGFDVSVNDDDTITADIGGNSIRYAEVEPLVYQELDGSRRIVFQVDAEGRGRYLFRADAPVAAATRLKWYESGPLQSGLLAGSVLVFATAFLFWPAIAFSVRGLQFASIKRTPSSAVLSVLAWLMSVLGICFVAGLAVVLKDRNQILFGPPPLVRGLEAATWASAVLAAFTVFGCVVAWRSGYWRFTGRLHYTLVALAGVAFTCFLYSWNWLTLGIGGM